MLHKSLSIIAKFQKLRSCVKGFQLTLENPKSWNLGLYQWFPTSGPRTTSGPQKPKYGPRTSLNLWLEMLKRSFCLIVTVNFYYTYMHSGPCYQEWYKSDPWSRKGWEPLIYVNPFIPDIGRTNYSNRNRIWRWECDFINITANRSAARSAIFGSRWVSYFKL